MYKSVVAKNSKLPQEAQVLEDEIAGLIEKPWRFKDYRSVIVEPKTIIRIIKANQKRHILMNKITDLKKLNTWDNRSSFKYNGSVKEGSKIFYGANQSTIVSAMIYERMLKHFKGRTVDCGTSRTSPQLDSLGEWIQENVIKRSLSSYVGAILVSEGYAVKRGSRIEFL